MTLWCTWIPRFLIFWWKSGLKYFISLCLVVYGCYLVWKKTVLICAKIRRISRSFILGSYVLLDISSNISYILTIMYLNWRCFFLCFNDKVLAYKTEVSLHAGDINWHRHNISRKWIFLVWIEVQYFSYRELNENEWILIYSFMAIALFFSGGNQVNENYVDL